MRTWLRALLVLAVSHVCILPSSVAAQEVETTTLEDGRFEATFTSSGDAHRYSGVAWLTRQGTLWLCPEGLDTPPNRPGMIYAMVQEPAGGEHPLGMGGVALVTRSMPAPVGQRPFSSVREGSSMTITVASEQLVAGSFEARYRDGMLAARFRAPVGLPPTGFSDLCLRSR